MIEQFIDLCVSLGRMGKSWLYQLSSSVCEAARTNSYVETVSPTKSDTLHRAIKETDIRTICRSYELQLRKKLRRLNIRYAKLAIDTTEDPYWGKQGKENTRASVDEKSEESWHFVNVAIVEPYFLPLMSLPYRQTDSLDTLVIELLTFVSSLTLRIDLVLFDRGFYHAHLIDYLEGKRNGTSIPYLMLVPRTNAVKEYLSSSTDLVNSFIHEMSYNYDKSGWKPTTTIVICKGVGKDKNGNPFDWCFATNQKPSLSLIVEYKKRWNIETGFRIHDEAKIKTKSSHLVIRFFYHLMSMLFVVLWRLKRALARFPLVFKRFLKEIQVWYESALTKPPPH
jgi:hypothetical protein